MAKQLPNPPSKIELKRCDLCEWWIADSKRGEKCGECHRYPPRGYEFPIVLGNNFCGEFKRKI